MANKSKIVAALEMGTSKVAVVVARIQPKKILEILGEACAPSQGVTKGEIVDFTALSHVVHAVLSEAEKKARTTIDHVYLTQTGGHVVGFFNEATVNVASSSGVVSGDDLNRAEAEARAKQLAGDQIYLHHIHNGYDLDGRFVARPLGIEGRRLSVGYWSMYADARHVRDAIHVVNGYGLEVEDVIVAGLASGLAVTTEREREAGVLVIDLGAGTTDFVLYSRGFARRAGTLSVGSDHVTNDVSLGLRIPTSKARMLKHDFAKAYLNQADTREKVWLVGDQSIGDRSVTRQALIQIVEARVRETMTILKKILEKEAPLPELPAGIVLTGGGSLLPGIDQVCAEVFERTVSLALIPSELKEELKNPGFSTVLGLLQYAYLDEGKRPDSLRLSLKKWISPAMAWLGFERN
jgi:cell division protein FtsA